VGNLPPEYEIELEELEIALRHIQNFDPTGIGARNLQECLALQLKVLPKLPDRTLALTIVEKHLDLLAARDFRQDSPADGLRRRRPEGGAFALITSLNPRPGAGFAQIEARYITPDVIVKKLKGQVDGLHQSGCLSSPAHQPFVCRNPGRQRRGNGNLTGQLQEARWLIKNMQQRFETIHRVTQAIVDRQRQFFEHGEVAMRPLVLREIADILGLHESTVSRVTSQKYMATPRGIFELKYFFGSHVSTDTGGACSATAIRALIKQLIAAEDSKKPLSDSQLSEILGQQGIVVARRTVAKYRESLSIPPVNLRKTL
jgi:RNA polymerase sigma-54 factor